MKQAIRYIDWRYAKPFVNHKGKLFIEWCGEILPVIGIRDGGAWIVPQRVK